MTTYGIPALEIIVCCTLTCIRVYLKPKKLGMLARIQEDSAARQMTQVSITSDIPFN